jgi:predicted DNA binding CopG/RHH family protein
MKTGLYSSVYEKGASAKTADFLQAKDAFEIALAKYETEQKARNERWTKITQVYQDYITRVSATADAKYRSNTSFDARISFEEPDLRELKAKVAEVPKLE